MILKQWRSPFNPQPQDYHDLHHLLETPITEEQKIPITREEFGGMLQPTSIDQLQSVRGDGQKAFMTVT